MKKQFKLNTALGGFAAKTILSLDVNSKGVPIVSYWCNRFKDALVDNCIELVEKAVSQKQPKPRSGYAEKREESRKKVAKDIPKDKIDV